MTVSFIRVAIVAVGIAASRVPVPAEVISVNPVTVLLIDEREVAAADAGLIQIMDIIEGSEVEQSQRIVSLDSAEQSLAVEAAEINLEAALLKGRSLLARDTAKAALEEARSGRGRIEASMNISRQLAEATAQIRIAEADRDAANTELNRAEKARARNRLAVSDSEILQLQTMTAKAGLQVEKANFDSSVAQLQPLVHQAELVEQDASIARFEMLLKQEQENIQLHQLSVKTMEKDVARTRLLLERRFVMAPISGVVTEVHRQSGEWVEKGTVIATIIDLRKLRVEGFVDVAYSSHRLIGASVVIRFPEILDEKTSMQGTVTHVLPRVDSINQKLRIWAEFQNPDLRVLPGMSGSMVLTIAPTAAVPAPQVKSRGNFQ